MIRWWEHFIDWALKFYWMPSICLTLFLVSPNPHRTTVSSICWWDTWTTRRVQKQSLLTVMMRTFGRWLASDQPGLGRNCPLEREIASISALACNAPPVYSSANHSLSLYLASPPLHEGKENSSTSPCLWLSKDGKDKDVQRYLVQLKNPWWKNTKAGPWYYASTTLELCPPRPPWPPSPRIISIVAARGISHHTTLLFQRHAGAGLTLSGCSQASSLSKSHLSH